MRPIHAFLAFCLAFLSALAAASDPLPPKEVFLPSISQTSNDNGFVTTVRITMPERYYLYVDKTDLSSEGIDGTVEKTPGIRKEDPYFGVQDVWYGEGSISFSHQQPATTFNLQTQGCEEDRLCYPPTHWTLVAEPAASKTASAFPRAPGRQTLFAGNGNNQVLPEEQAFPVHAISENGQALVRFALPDGYYLYRDKFNASIEGRPLQPLFPAGELHTDEFFGEQTIYRGETTIPLPLSWNDNGKSVVIRFQGCADVGVCYPPMTRALAFGDLTPALDSPPPVAQEREPDSNIHPIQRALGEHFWRNLPLVLLLGISVSFTACVYPLIPIVTSLVVGKEATPRRSFALIGVYVLGMASAMALVGALFGLFNINLQLILQKPLFVTIAALIFVALSLSLFDVYTLQTPRWLQKPVDRLSRRQSAGSFGGAATMGALSVLIVSSCATPVLAALLLFTAQTSTVKSAIALFVFGLGTGLPLFLFASVLRRFMPKAGAWMNVVKRGFAFALLAIALWLVMRIMSAPPALALWSAYGAFLANTLFPWRSQDAGKIVALRRFAALLVLVFSLALANQAVQHSLQPVSGQAGTITHFTAIDDQSALQQAIAASDKPVIVDIYADWCISCRVWERDIWHNPAMVEALSRFTLLKVDVTDFNADHQALFRRLNIIAPPTVLIYPQESEADKPASLIVGEMRAPDFAHELEKWR